MPTPSTNPTPRPRPPAPANVRARVARCEGRKTSTSQKRGSTSGRFPNEINGPSYVKPKGGAPKGNRNALRHGAYSAESIAFRARIRAFLRRNRELNALAKVYLALRRGQELSGEWLAILRDIAMPSATESPSSAKPSAPKSRPSPVLSLPQERSRPALATRTRPARKAHQMVLFRTRSRAGPKPLTGVLTGIQNLNRTFSRVSDLFVGDSPAVPRRKEIQC